MVLSKVIDLHAVHLKRPEISGRSFSDIENLPEDTINRLCADDMVFLTEFTRHGKTYGGSIIARSEVHAKRIADSRHLGETIIGLLRERGAY